MAAQAGDDDEAAFAEIVRRFSPRVFRVAARFFKSHGLIEEAAQEIFLKTFTQIKNFENRGSLEGWITRIAYTTCVNLTRAAGYGSEISVADLNRNSGETEIERLEKHLYQAHRSESRTAEDELVSRDLAERLLNILSKEDALVLSLMDGAGESVRDVAKTVGWSESKVKTNAFRARRRLREAFQKLYNSASMRDEEQ